MTEPPAEDDRAACPWQGREGVRHVLISGLSDAEALETGGEYTVLWLGDRAVGHVNGHHGKLAPDPVDAARLAEIQSEEATLRPPSLSASVVICTRDRPEELARCLASLPEQTYPPREIIVVDNASKDSRTREAAEAAGVVYVREDRPGLDIARNTGALRATGDIVAYTDDDVLLHPRWLERLVAAFDAPEIAAVTGLVLPAELATEAQRHFEFHWGFNKGFRRRDFTAAGFSQYPEEVVPAWDIGAGASMAFRRMMFDTVGLFDERLDVGQAGCSGDSEYWYRLLDAGYGCRYEPASVAFHFHRRAMEGLASQVFHYMRGHAAALMVQHERTRIPANRIRALSYMPRWYAGRLWRRVRNGAAPEDRFLRQEIAGYVSGLLFYWRNRKGLAR